MAAKLKLVQTTPSTKMQRVKPVGRKKDAD
jgi:hypothetical protein